MKDEVTSRHCSIQFKTVLWSFLKQIMQRRHQYGFGPAKQHLRPQKCKQTTFIGILKIPVRQIQYNDSLVHNVKLFCTCWWNTKFSLRRAVTVKQRCSFVIKIRRSFRFWCILKIIVLKYKNHFLRCLLKEKFWKDLTFSVDSKL